MTIETFTILLIVFMVRNPVIRWLGISEREGVWSGRQGQGQMEKVMVRPKWSEGKRVRVLGIFQLKSMEICLGLILEFCFTRILSSLILLLSKGRNHPIIELFLGSQVYPAFSFSSSSQTSQNQYLYTINVSLIKCRFRSPSSTIFFLSKASLISLSKLRFLASFSLSTIFPIWLSLFSYFSSIATRWVATTINPFVQAMTRLSDWQRILRGHSEKMTTEISLFLIMGQEKQGYLLESLERSLGQKEAVISFRQQMLEGEERMWLMMWVQRLEGWVMGETQRFRSWRTLKVEMVIEDVIEQRLQCEDIEYKLISKGSG